MTQIPLHVNKKIVLEMHLGNEIACVGYVTLRICRSCENSLSIYIY